METLGFNTIAADSWRRSRALPRPISPNLTRSTIHQFESAEQLKEQFLNRREKKTDLVYSRLGGNETAREAAAKIAELEGAECGLVLSSGMAAVTTASMALLRAGDAVLAPTHLFAQTRTFLSRTLHGYGVKTSFVDMEDLAAVARAIRNTPHLKLVYLETPSNPSLRITDIKAVVELAKPKSILVVADNTIASPFNQQPLSLGVDLVIHSATKYLNGHHDVMCGAVVGSRAVVDLIEEMQELLGTVLDPQAAWLLLRGMKSMGLRLARQNSSALKIAQYLSSHSEVSAVEHPFLEGARGFAVARRQMRGGGGMVCFELRGGLEAAKRFLNSLNLIAIATSLGGLNSVVEIPGDLDFNEKELGETAMERNGGTIRLSVGIEETEDLLRDIGNALESCH